MTIEDPLWPRAGQWLQSDPVGDVGLAVVGLPTSSGSLSPSEAWRTPAAVREALHRLASFDGESGTDLRELAAADVGDLPLTGLDPAEAVAAIEHAVRALPVGPVYAYLGGDNLVTHPLVKGNNQTPLERMGLLTFDAHHDVRERADGQPSNGSPVRMLIQDGLAGDHVAQIGIHTFANSREYRDWCDERGIRVVTMAEVEDAGIEAVVGPALEELASRCDAIHVDVDIDVLDRAFAPACPGSRPGGMTPRQLFDGVRRCGAHPAVVSADFVEVDVTHDVADTTVLATATALLSFAVGISQRART
ncbi:MAG: agmatinase family protein [Actinobacteria bacterium]|nr:agmatinase family protein [Actinomycetota bacterium]